ncbi:metallophosphoesterase [candidate division KSB1 bacterium]|nr:metallophosphoesterase [candidate division KSB1 bacterium]
MRKIIHLSDLHFGWKKKIDTALKNIVHNICFEKEPAADYVIVITGDLVDNANDRKQIDLMEFLLILDAAGFDVLMVPGNHDYGSGVSGKKKFVKEFKQLFFDNIDYEYPKVDIIHDTEAPDNISETIAFIGLDTMAEELGLLDHLWAEGELGQAQLDRLDAILFQENIKSCGKRVIYMHHHPFDPYPYHQLKDSELLELLLKKHITAGTTIDALLYGHNHRGRSHHGKWGIPRCYDGSSSTGKKKDKHQEILQRVIDLKRDPRWDYNGNFHL